jgi:hypothetical protein
MLLAAKTELKTIASKIVQHPAATIERIKLRRRVIELSVQTTTERGRRPPRKAATPNRTGYAWPGGGYMMSGQTARLRQH